MQCLTDTGSGFVITSPQPEKITDCTNILVQPNELANELFQYSFQDWQIISVALVGVLVVGFSFRAIAQALNTNDGESE